MKAQLWNILTGGLKMFDGSSPVKHSPYGLGSHSIKETGTIRLDPRQKDGYVKTFRATVIDRNRY